MNPLTSIVEMAMEKATELPLPKKERYTYDDYAQLPEGAPYELIRGELVHEPSPTTYHQRLSKRLFRWFDAFVEQEQLGEVFFAPLDVYFSEFDTLQPDLVFISGERSDVVGEKKLEGAPDLVVEILSPSTAYRDLGVKKRLYEEHGVKEYWIVDPEQTTVEIHSNTPQGFVQHARVVETGSVTSALLQDFSVDVVDLFRRP